MAKLTQLSMDGGELPVFTGDGRETAEQFIFDNISTVTETYQGAGVVLFRNFSTPDLEFLNRISGSLVGEAMPQVGRYTLRSRVSGGIHTSTEHSRKAFIALHSESVYLPVFPRSILFFCELAAQTGGRTPIANLQAITKSVPESIKRKVRESGVRYVRRIGVLPGQDWRKTYHSISKADLTKKLEATGAEAQWDRDVLTTNRLLPGLLEHPDSGQEIWFNALYSSNSLTLPDVQREFLIREFGKDGLPSETYFGSGESLSQSEFVELENAYNSNRVSFEWQDGDLLWLDNLKHAHGRDPYTGDRKLFAVLGGAAEWQDLGTTARGSDSPPATSSQD